MLQAPQAGLNFQENSPKMNGVRCHVLLSPFCSSSLMTHTHACKCMNGLSIWCLCVCVMFSMRTRGGGVCSLDSFRRIVCFLSVFFVSDDGGVCLCVEETHMYSSLPFKRGKDWVVRVDATYMHIVIIIISKTTLNVYVWIFASLAYRHPTKRRCC